MKEERFPHIRKAIHEWRLWVAEGGNFGAMEQSAATGVQRAKQRDSCTEDWCRPTLTSPRGLSAHPPGDGVWELRLWLHRLDPSERDWGWLHEHSMKGASEPQLARRESRKKSGTAEEARDFLLPLCFLVREERRLRAPLKGAPEMGANHGYQRRPQRRHEMLRLLLQPPRNLCSSTEHYPHLPSPEPVQPATARVP